MKILIRVIGVKGSVFPLPDGWPVPRTGEGFSSPECPSGTVTSVTHYPSGEFDGFANGVEVIGDPMVYVVVVPDNMR